MSFMDKFKILESNVGKDIGLFLFSAISLVIIYSIHSYLHINQEILLKNIAFMRRSIKEKSDTITSFNRNLESIKKIFQNANKEDKSSKKMPKKRLAVILKSLGNKHEFLHLHFSFIPGESSHKDKAFIMTKNIVKIQFSAKNDLYVFRFLKDIMRKFPGIINSKEIKLKKEILSYDEEQYSGLKYIVKGSYQFEWYDVCFIK